MHTHNISTLTDGKRFFKHSWTYDTWGRMTDYFLNPTNSADNGQHISHYDYDLRSRLTQRNLGKQGSSNWLQSLDYTYNELDWLTAINPQGSTGLGTTQNMNEPLGIPTPGFNPASTDPDNNDLFFLELKYHDPYTNLDVPAISRKSGDVSQVWWRARGRNREGYGLTYDYLGRMTKAQHVRLADGSSSTTPGARIINNYSEQLEYADQRGNIARILRYGMNYTSGTQAGSGVIDDLQFIADPGRNRILRINEQASDLVFKLKGFRPKTEANGSTSTGGIDYSYDANGNQTSDPHKGITSIQYNYLNLPVLISYADGRKIEQRYDAAGTLIFRWMTGDVTTPANNYFQTYIYGIEYRGSFMESVAHQEGRLFNTVNSTVNASWRYEYSISDHLGNTRLTFTDKATADGIIKVEDGEVLEEAHYYPFGLAMEGPWMNDAAALDTRYKFNGIERIQDFGLNVDMAMYRAYDPAIGRWWQIDPMAAMAPEQTPYRFGFNNPMNFSDPFGLFETRKEAREYKKEHDTDGRVRKNSEGRFDIRTKEGFITKSANGSYEAGAFAKDESLSDKEATEQPRPPEMGTWEWDVYRYKANDNGTYGWYYRGSREPYIAPKSLAEGIGRMFAGFAMVRGGSLAIHHIASNKHAFYSRLFKEIADKYKLTLNGKWNKVSISTQYHYSKHPSEYHEFVLQGLQAADAAAAGDKLKFLELFDKFVKQPLMANPNMLNKTGW
jgi:RHS repeat-associated protein